MSPASVSCSLKLIVICIKISHTKQKVSRNANSHICCIPCLAMIAMMWEDWLHCDCSFEHFRSSLSNSRRVFLSAHTSNALEIIKFYATLAEQREEWNVKRKIPTTSSSLRESLEFELHISDYTHISWVNRYTFCVFFLAHLLSHSRALNTRHGARLAWFPFNIASKHTHNIYALACAIWLFKVSSYFFSALCVRTLYFLFIFSLRLISVSIRLLSLLPVLSSFFFALSSFVRHTTTAAG